MTGEHYITLMASLPALGPMLAAKHAPINRIRLESRLRQLHPEHRSELQSVADLLAWHRLPLTGVDAEFVRHAGRVIPSLKSETLAVLTRDRMELRTLVAALRRRHQGHDAPAADVLWGYGRFLNRIRANWREPGFGVEQSFRWILSAHTALENQESTRLEHILIEAAWRQAERLSVSHHFDFEAVALYIVRWNLLNRWTRYDAQAAAARFQELLTDALEHGFNPARPDALQQADR